MNMLQVKRMVKSAEKDLKKSEKEIARLKKEQEKYRSFTDENALYLNQEVTWYCKTLRRIQGMVDKSTEEILLTLMTNVEYHPKVKKRLERQLKKLRKGKCNKTIKECLDDIMRGYLPEEEILKNKLMEIEEPLEVNKEFHKNNNNVEGKKEVLETTNKPEEYSYDLNNKSSETTYESGEHCDKLEESKKPLEKNNDSGEHKHNLEQEMNESRGNNYETQNEIVGEEVLPVSSNAAITASVGQNDPLGKVKRPIQKRCHCCKKKGHLIKNCPIKRNCKEWLKNLNKECH